MTHNSKRINGHRFACKIVTTVLVPAGQAGGAGRACGGEGVSPRRVLPRDIPPHTICIIVR
jgi:hypothetical protein